jgi:hypothetical protein
MGLLRILVEAPPCHGCGLLCVVCVSGVVDFVGLVVFVPGVICVGVVVDFVGLVVFVPWVVCVCGVMDFVLWV